MTAADWTTIGQPQDIRLVVADMDGTLLDERSRIPDGFWPMLARLKRRGVEFVPASGRQYATLRNMFADKAAEILDGGELSYIAENGNVVALDGKVVEVHGVDLDVTRNVPRVTSATWSPTPLPPASITWDWWCVASNRHTCSVPTSRSSMKSANTTRR